MNIKAYSFEQNSHTLAEVKRSVSEQLACAGVYFQSYSDAKEMFSKINEEIDSADVILIGVEKKAFLKFKPVFIKAFGYTPAYSEKILNRIGDVISDDKIKKAHAYVPDESSELLADDGTYSGFYVNENDQFIVVFPLAADNLPALLAVEELSFVKPIEDSAAIMASIIDTEQSSDKASTIVDKLKSNNLKLAIPSTPAIKAVKNDIHACENADSYVFFTPFVNDAGVEDPKQYAADLAKSARELRAADLGATISNIFREKKGDKVIGYYAYISVATEDKIVIKKLSADPDESIENLVLEASNELYSMIDKYVDETAFKLTASPDDVEKYENAMIEAEVVSDIRPEATVSKFGVIAAIVAIVVAVIVCLILTFKYADVFVSPLDAPENDNLQAGNPSPTVIENTDPETTRFINIDEATVLEPSQSESDTSLGEFNIPTTIPAGINVSDQNVQGGSSGGNQRPATTAPTTEPTTAPTTAPTTEPTTEDEPDIVI